MSDKHLRQGETRIVALPQSVENSPTTLFHPAKDPSIAQLQLYVSPLFPTLAIADIVIIQSPEPGLYFALATDKLPDLCLMTSKLFDRVKATQESVSTLMTEKSSLLGRLDAIIASNTIKDGQIKSLIETQQSDVSRHETALASLTTQLQTATQSHAQTASALHKLSQSYEQSQKASILLRRPLIMYGVLSAIGHLVAQSKKPHPFTLGEDDDRIKKKLTKAVNSPHSPEIVSLIARQPLLAKMIAPVDIQRFCDSVEVGRRHEAAHPDMTPEMLLKEMLLLEGVCHDTAKPSEETEALELLLAVWGPAESTKIYDTLQTQAIGDSKLDPEQRKRLEHLLI